MTEISKTNEAHLTLRYSVGWTAFFFALILAPLLVTFLSFWTVIGFYAFFLGVIPYLVIGTPILIWAVGRIRPDFWSYASLGFGGNIIMAIVMAIGFPSLPLELFFLFGLIFAPLYAGTFGYLYAQFHTDISILKP